jgi:peptidoglycan/LPS O-acetylase OafA/YrhL
MFLVRRIFRLYPAHIVSIVGVILLALIFFVGKAPIDFSPYRPADNPFFADCINGTIFNPMRLTSIIGNLAMATWSMNLVVWSLYVEACAAPLLPIFHRISRANSVGLDIATIAALIAISTALSGQLWIEYWFIFYLGMIVQTRGRDWAHFVANRIGPRTAVVISFAVTIFPELFFRGRPPVVFIIEALGAFSILSLIVWSRKTDLFRIFEHPVLRWNGRLSYSFYLWHFIVLTIVTRQLYASLSPEAMHRYEIVIFMATILGTAALALGIAQLSYSFVELPFISVGRKIISTWKQTAFGRVVPSSL